jgi:hypothetical protein
LEALVDHLNRTVSAAEMQRAYAPAVQAYAAAPQAIGLAETRSSSAVWLLEQLTTAKTVTCDREKNRDRSPDR